MATTNGPSKLTVRTYGVGFGDCFLLTFTYSAKKQRHVMIDFGSKSAQAGAKPTRMKEIALDIKKVTRGKLHALVATHRHQDHISGFTPGKSGNDSTGDVIRSLLPDLVVQPWTEKPDLAKNAESLIASNEQIHGVDPVVRVASLLNMQGVAEHVLDELVLMKKGVAQELVDHLTFVGEDAVKNPEAVRNLIAMGKAGNARYLSEGMDSGLKAVLPGVTVHVLGPPTLKQERSILSESPKEPGNYWKLQLAATKLAFNHRARGKKLFPRARSTRGPMFPESTQWFIAHARRQRSTQLTAITSMLDDALNNTSLILVFEAGNKTFLFPGDAQIENWQWALKQPKYRALLKNVDVYKVGHHGSRNATPGDLWELFGKRSTHGESKKQLTSLLSTKANVYGTKKNEAEVPRGSLLRTLKQQTELHSTEQLQAGQLCEIVEFTLR